MPYLLVILGCISGGIFAGVAAQNSWTGLVGFVAMVIYSVALEFLAPYLR